MAGAGRRASSKPINRSRVGRGRERGGAAGAAASAGAGLPVGCGGRPVRRHYPAGAAGGFSRDQGLSLTGELEADTSAALFNAQTQAAQYPVLSKGMQNKRVLELQQRLWQLGFFSGDLDGQYGSQTVLGVKALQTYIQFSGRFDWPGILLGMDLNRVADPLVLATLYSDFPPAPGPWRRGTAARTYTGSSGG